MGFGGSAIGWYRTALPALTLGCDWIGVRGLPPDLQVRSALTRSGSSDVNFEDYKIVILQQPHGTRWLGEIRRLQERGVTVLYEIDDYIHAVRKTPGHLSAKRYSKQFVAEHELCMKACDGIIVSTPFLAERYRKFNRSIYLCENAIDVDRYAPFRPTSRSAIHIGWAGTIGQDSAVIPWFEAVTKIMLRYANTSFVTIGAEYAESLRGNFPGRTLAIPTVQIENYPAALTNFDIALAPAGRGSFFQGKSDLRFVEAAAVHLPVVADPFLYSRVRDGDTGLLASTPQEAYAQIERLVLDADLRHRIGESAFAYVAAERDIESRADAWSDAFVQAYSRRQRVA